MNLYLTIRKKKDKSPNLYEDKLELTKSSGIHASEKSFLLRKGHKAAGEEE